MRILSRYFVARFLGLFATVLIAALLILATVELVFNFDDLATFGSARSLEASSPADPSQPTQKTSTVRANQTDNHANRDATLGTNRGGLATLARSLCLRLASYYLADLIPIASFLAVFITVAWAGRAMEILAIQAGGIQLRRIVFPILATTLILSLVTVLLHETVILRAQQISSNQETDSDHLPDFGRESFWYHRGRTITNISFADARSRTLHGVEIFERGDNGKIVRVIRADEIRIDSDGVWQLEDASVWLFDPRDPTQDPDFRQNQSMALNLSAVGGDALLRADPEQLSLRALGTYLQSNPELNPSKLRRLQSGYHSRLASPWLVIAFGWLALPFALRVDEKGRFGLPAAAAIGVLGAVYFFQNTGTTLSLRELIPIGLTPWLTLAIIGLGSAIALRRRGF